MQVLALHRLIVRLYYNISQSTVVVKFFVVWTLSLSLSQDNIRIRKMCLDLINLKVWTSTLLKSWHYFTGRRSHYSSTFLQQNSAAHCNESWSKGRVCLPAKSCIFRDVKRLIDIIGDTFNFCLVTYIFKWTNQI